MRFDIFLSSLLFGITLLTCAMAIMHLFCDALIRSQDFPLRTRKRIRQLLLGSTISISLLIFLIRLSLDISGPGFLGFGTEHSFFPRRIARFEAAARTTVHVDPPWQVLNTWTLFPKPTHELRTQKLQASNIPLFSKSVFVWAPAVPDVLCSSWIDRLRGLGLEPRISHVLSGVPKGALIVACPGTASARQTWDDIRSHVFNGGSLLALGRLPPEASEAVQAMAHILEFHAADPKSPVKVVLGGPRLEWGGFPSGLRIFLGGDQKFYHDLSLAEVSGDRTDSCAVTEDFDPAHSRYITAPKLSAMVSANYGQGRVTWAGVPGRLFGKAELLWGSAWSLMTQRIVAGLLQVPQAGLELWPAGNPSPVVLAVHSETDPAQDNDLVNDFRYLNVPASHYVILSEAQAHRRQFARLLDSKDEIGLSEPDHAPVSDLDFYDRYDRIKRWLAGFFDLPRDEDPGKSATTSRRIMGALTEPGANAYADQYAALMANRLSYALMDPFGDQLSPYVTYLTKTSDLIAHLSAGRSIEDAAGMRAITILPHRSMDDAALFRAAGGPSEATEIRKLLLEQYRYTRWAGGPFLFRISTGTLGADRESTLLESLIRSLSSEGASFLKAEDLLHFWQIRSDAEVVLEPIDRSRVPADLDSKGSGDSSDSADDDVSDSDPDLSSGDFDEIAFRVVVTNNSADPLQKSALRITEPGTFRVLVRKGSPAAAESGDTIRINLPDLRPGESYSAWIVRKQPSD